MIPDAGWIGGRMVPAGHAVTVLPVVTGFLAGLPVGEEVLTPFVISSGSSVGNSTTEQFNRSVGGHLTPSWVNFRVYRLRRGLWAQRRLGRLAAWPLSCRSQAVADFWHP